MSFWIAVTVLMAGCGAGSDSANEAAGTTDEPEPELVRVPNVRGDKADEAAARIERARLSATFDPDPDDAELCTVESQDEVGEIEAGTEVILSLACKVVVPDVRGERYADGAEKIEALDDLTVDVVADGSGDPADCSIVDQDERGKVESGTEILLTVDCPLTVAEVKSNAASLARQSAVEDGGDYEVHSCEVVGDDQGQCQVSYFNTPSGVDCVATIDVFDEGDTIHSEQRDAECF